MAQIDGAGQQDTNNQNAEALQAAFAQREVTLQGQPQGGSDVPSHQISDPAVRRIGNSTVPSGSYRKTSCTVRSRWQWDVTHCNLLQLTESCCVGQPAQILPKSLKRLVAEEGLEPPTQGL